MNIPLYGAAAASNGEENMMDPVMATDCSEGSNLVLILNSPASKPLWFFYLNN